MSRYLYKTTVLKTIPLSDMPDYNPTSPKWNPTTITYHLADNATAANPVYVSRTSFTPQLERALKLMEGKSPAETSPGDSFSNLESRTRYRPIPPETLAKFIDYANAKQAQAVKSKALKGINSTAGLNTVRGQSRVEKVQRSDGVAQKSKMRTLFDLTSLKSSSANANVKEDAADAIEKRCMNPIVQKGNIAGGSTADSADKGAEQPKELGNAELTQTRSQGSGIVPKVESPALASIGFLTKDLVIRKKM